VTDAASERHSSEQSSSEERSSDDRWALITGAGKRIGRAIAIELHGAGYNVAIHYFSSAEPADELAHMLNEQRPGSALTAGADLRDVTALTRLVTEVLSRTQRLDVLINNASTFYPTPLGEITDEVWHDLIDSNLKAPLFLAQAMMTELKRNRGTIVNIVDIHATRPLRDFVVYGPAKAGLAMLTRSLAKDLAPDVRVNGVAPGAILWPEAGISEKTQASIVREIPLKREGDPSDIAKAVLFLVRDAPYVTGQVLAVDGGRSIGW
jgi:pteridine reductase